MAEGYDIVAAQNGEEALVVAKQNKPDLIISDVMMPRISGFEMLDILRNTDGLKHTKVIMLTALGQAEDQTRADNLGADKYLVKSQVTLEDIVNSAKELLAADGAIPATPAPADPAAAPASEPTATDAAAPSAPEPAPAATPTPAPAEPAAPAADTAVPASVAPQPGTDVVVPPAPADPTPPTVTSVPMSAPPAEPAAPQAPAADSTPATDTASADAAAQSVADAAPQSMAAEEASLQAQIDGYVNAPGTSTPAADAASNDQTIENAVEQLNAASTDAAAQPAPAEPATDTAAPSAPEPAPAEPVTPEAAADNDQASVAGKKVIQPISDPAAPKPDLNELLAKEEAKEQAAAAPAAAPTPPAAPQGPVPDGVDHNSITL
jgi:CheY-like chemotaxis protein